MNWKKILIAFLVLVFPLACWAVPTSMAEAAAPIKVFVNGEKLSFPDVQPVAANGRVLVPVRLLETCLWGSCFMTEQKGDY